MEPLPPCSRCGTTAPPLENGQCSNNNPRCRVFRHGHQLSRKYALDENDVRVKAARYVRDYDAATEDMRDACRELAETVCTLKKMRKGTAEHQRLLAARQDLRAELEAARAARQPAGTSGGPRVVFYLPHNGRGPFDEPVPEPEPFDLFMSFQQQSMVRGDRLLRT